MSNGSQRLERKARDASGRTDPAAPDHRASGPQAPTSEAATGQGQQKTKTATTARKRKPPFVL